MSLFQALCLLMFNDGEEYSLEEICEATKIGHNCLEIILSHGSFLHIHAAILISWQFLPLDETVAYRMVIVIVIVSGVGGQKRFLHQLNNSKTVGHRSNVSIGS